MRMAMQRNQFNSPNQQQQFQLQQQQMNMANNLAAQGMNMNMPNANIMASMGNQNLNGNMSASMNGMPNNASSPRVNQATPNMQRQNVQGQSPHVPQYLQLQSTIKMQHPDWTNEQVQKSASEQLQRYMAKQRVQAMNAAAGSPGMSSPSPQIANNQFMQQQNGGMANSPPVNAVQNYQQQLVQQQRLMSQQRQTSQQASSPGMNGRPPSRSATPQNPQQMQQSPGLAQAQPNRTS
jgi:chromatin modification-related protein VID21